MFDIGFAELLVLAVVGLLVLGPERLPEAARTLGVMLGRVRRSFNSLRDEVQRELRADELRKKLEEERKSLGMDEISKSFEESIRNAKAQLQDTTAELHDQPVATDKKEGASGQSGTSSTTREAGNSSKDLA